MLRLGKLRAYSKTLDYVGKISAKDKLAIWTFVDYGRARFYKIGRSLNVTMRTLTLDVLSDKGIFS